MPGRSKRIDRRSESREMREEQQLDRELRETSRLLQQAYVAFDLVSDPDLIEAWVYEIDAQRARYTYLLKQRKALSLPRQQEREVEP